MTEERTFRIFYVVDGEREPGPTFPSLEAALDHARGQRGHRACDILLPNGQWYAKQQTVGHAPGNIGSAKAERIADEAVAWMRSRPSRSSRGGRKPNGSEGSS